MLIQKTLKLEEVSLKIDGETGKFSGYASVFGGIDSYGDTILKGAFQHAIASEMPKMFFNHSWDMPIGKWTKAEEDSKGLPATKLHGLRMLNTEVFSRLPLASADSTNIAQNVGIDSKWRGTYTPASKESKARVLRERIESVQSMMFWEKQSIQMELAA